jgi:hypothetical protein
VPACSSKVDARWFDIDTDARLDGIELGTIEIDPYAFGLSLGNRFSSDGRLRTDLPFPHSATAGPRKSYRTVFRLRQNTDAWQTI